MNITRHNSYFALTRSDNSRTVGSDQYSRAPLHITGHFYHIKHWNPFGNTNHQVEFCVHGFHYGVCCKCWRYIDYTSGCACSRLSSYNSIEYRKANLTAIFKRDIDRCSTFTRCYPSNHLCSIIQRTFSMEQTR
ncbi:hypothetical protein D3C75_816710 [compost metagenome]